MQASRLALRVHVARFGICAQASTVTSSETLISAIFRVIRMGFLTKRKTSSIMPFVTAGKREWFGCIVIL
jgi:hypothetical protein